MIRNKMTRRQILGAAIAVPAAQRTASAMFQSPSAVGNAPRVRESFDFGWKFRRGDVAGAESLTFSDSGWQPVDLPHDWSIEGPYTETEPTGGPGGYLPTGIGWYRKTFRVPAPVQRESSLSSSTASTNTATFGSMGDISAIARTVTSASVMT